MSSNPQELNALPKNLARHLFADTSLNAYAILDGASNPALLDHLYADQPEFACLYRGKLEPDIAECAPYLARLEPGVPFTEWVITKHWGHHWGIFAVANCDLATLRRHLRKFNMVYDTESHSSLLFRYYDPRVLSVFLPSCDAEQMNSFFGPVQGFFAETAGGQSLARFLKGQQQVSSEIVQESRHR